MTEYLIDATDTCHLEAKEKKRSLLPFARHEYFQSAEAAGNFPLVIAGGHHCLCHLWLAHLLYQQSMKTQEAVDENTVSTARMTPRQAR